MLDKAIRHGKEHRAPYRGSKVIDRSCRNHGECPYCKGNRLYSSKKRIEAATDKEKNFFILFLETP